MMVNKEFLVLIVIVFVIAAPIAYWILNQWLNNFAYHIGIGLLPLAGALLVTCLIATITISNESAKAVLANPASTLRSE